MTAGDRILIDRLGAARNLAEVVQIDRDLLFCGSLIGRVLAFGDAVVLVARCSDDAEPDGYTAIAKADITRVHGGSKDLLFLEKTPVVGGAGWSWADGGPSTLMELIDPLQRSAGFIEVHSEVSRDGFVLTGICDAIDETHVRLDAWGDLRTQDRRTVIVRRDAITRVDAGTTAGRRLQAALGLAGSEPPRVADLARKPRPKLRPKSKS